MANKPFEFQSFSVQDAEFYMLMRLSWSLEVDKDYISILAKD